MDVSFPPPVAQAVLCALVTGWASRKTPVTVPDNSPMRQGLAKDERLEPEVAHQPPSMGRGAPMDGWGWFFWGRLSVLKTFKL